MRISVARERTPWFFSAVVITAGFAAASASDDVQDPGDRTLNHELARRDTKANWALSDPQRATTCTCKLLGIALENEVSKCSATLSTLKQDNTPFLSAQVKGGPLWHVVVPDWRIRLKSAKAESGGPYVRTFDVYLDPLTGQLIKARSRWPEDEPPIPPEPTAAQAEEQFRRASNEKYHSFPLETPRVTLAEALDSMYRSGVDVFRAKQVVAQCVIRSTDFEKPKVVWAITLRGVSAYRSLPGWPEGEVYQYRYLVDATTGRYESATNIPWPRSWEPVSPEENDEE